MTEKDLDKPVADSSLCTFNIKSRLNYVLKIQLGPRSKHTLRSTQNTRMSMRAERRIRELTPCDTQRDNWA